MTRFQSSKEDVAYSIDGMSRFEDSPCFLVALDNWDISLIISSLRYAHWRRRWLDLGGKSWDEVEAKVDNLERCLMSGCNVDTLVEVLQNALYYDDKGLAQILSEGQSAGQEGSVTLAEVLENFEGDDIVQYPAVYGVLQVLADILPPDFVENYKIIDPPQFAFNIVAELVKTIVGIIDTSFNGVSATAGTGEVVSDAANTAISGLDTIFSGMTAGALSLSAILDLIGLFKSGQTPPADDNPALHTQVRVLNDVFVTQGAISCAPDVTVNCGGGCGGQPVFDNGQDISNFVDTPPVEEPDLQGDPPSGFDSWEEYFEYKCGAANFYYDQYVGTLTNWAGLAGVTGALTIAVVMGLVLMIVPPLGIALILAALVAIAGVDIGLFATFLDIVSGLNDSKETIICNLFETTSSDSAVGILTTATNSVIDGLEISSTLKDNFKSACSYLLSNSSAKVLFEETGAAVGYEGSIDCSVCGGDFECVLIPEYPNDYPNEITQINSTTWNVLGYNAGGGRYATLVTFQNDENRTLVSITRNSGGNETNVGGTRYGHLEWFENCELQALSSDFGVDITAWINSRCPIAGFHGLQYNYAGYESQPDYTLVFSGDCDGCI